MTIPARNEELHIVESLQALAMQADLTRFEVMVFANNCTDGTAARARAFGHSNRLRLHVIEGTLPEHIAHVGTARKMLMDEAAARFIAAGVPHGIVATTDADTLVAPDWVERTIDEMRTVDAVAGFVEVHPADRRLMPASARQLYVREFAYRRAWTELESLIDARPEDPPPRHGAFVGASLAVSAAMYVRAGGIPQLASLEDREFLSALRRVDARIRHSLRVRAWTSGRRNARVAGGFGTFLRHLHVQGSRGQTLFVKDPRSIVEELDRRAAARRIWSGAEAPHDRFRVCATFGITHAECSTLSDRRLPFGTVYERINSLARTPIANDDMVPVDEAIAFLQAVLSERKAGHR